MAVPSPRATNPRGYPTAPPYWANAEEGFRKLAELINSLRDGKINSVGSVTLTANSTTTTLSDPKIGPNSHVSLTPTTDSATTAWAAGIKVVSSDGTATLTHNNTADLDKTLTYSILG